MPHGLRRFLAEQVFRMPENHARVVSGHVGGSFGMPRCVPGAGAGALGGKARGTAGEVAGRREGVLIDEHGRTMCRRVQLAGEAGAIAVK
jgi:CO/xanthine dehydrogenase Mo-binding subunit